MTMHVKNHKGREMNDYTSMLIHRAKQAEYERDAEQARLAQKLGKSWIARLTLWLPTPWKKVRPAIADADALVDTQPISTA